MSRRLASAVPILCLVAALRLAAGERPGAQIDVIPTPKHLEFESGAFEIDQDAIVLVSEQATLGTRRAARVAQLGIRERFGIDLPIVRISEKAKYGARKDIWIVEPHLLRPPENTIGVKGLKFTEEMLAEGYFIRVDAVAAVVHGASDAGSCYGAQTLLQLIRPPRKKTLLRTARGPTIPCLWIRDWPSTPERVVPSEIGVPSDPGAAERFVMTLARYKLNGISRSALPADEATLERLREAAERFPIRWVDRTAALGRTPLAALALAWAREGEVGHALAACGEEAWGPPDPEPDVLRRRLGVAAP